MTSNLELIRRVRDQALAEAACVLGDGLNLWDAAARIRARQSRVFVRPTPAEVLRDLGVDYEPRYW